MVETNSGKNERKTTNAEKNDEKKDSLASDYVTDKYRQDISPEIGKISKEEIFSAATNDQRVADTLILNFAQALSKFSSWEDINIGIQVLQVALHEFGLNQVISELQLFEHYCASFAPIGLEEFKKILDKMKSKTSIAVFRIHFNGLFLTDTGFFVYENYQRMKAELLSAKKAGTNEKISRLFLFFRNYILNSSDGIETDWLFSANYLLEQAITSISEGGEELIYSDKFYPQLTKIHDLIDKILVFERDNLDSNIYSIQAYAELQTELTKTIRAMLTHSGTRLGEVFKSPDIILKRTPFPTMERTFIDLMDSGIWEDLFLRNPTCAWPTQLLMGFNSNTLEKNILALVSEAPKDHINDLPTEPPNGMEECDISEAMVKEDEYNQIQVELETLVNQNQQGLDYELVKNKNPVKFFSNLASFYQLVGEGRVNLDPTPQVKSDEDNSIRHFTARIYSAIIPGEANSNE
ncbi:MAG: hypothetical protein RBG13Loki_1528 [Promethearchaeota archaeon CR_4]|nr:MAG: hypothetical protein RBG13Loki_1528 [Candidatus Lokiarchaeota archaeon CR_4]